MKLRTIFGCVLAGVLWVLLAADARCVASDGETPLPAPSELTRQVPVRVADAYGLRALLVRLSLEAGDTSAFDPDAGSRPGLSVPRRSVRRVGTGCLICPVGGRTACARRRGSDSPAAENPDLADAPTPAGRGFFPPARNLPLRNLSDRFRPAGAETARIVPNAENKEGKFSFSIRRTALSAGSSGCRKHLL